MASHIEAGEITYRRLSGYNYEITLVIYAKIASQVFSPIDVFRFGDGTTANLTDPTSTDTLPGKETVKRIYKITSHAYPGPGKYIISADHRDRIDNVLNINGGNSLHVSFYVETELIINPFNPTNGQIANNSPILTNPPIDVACVGAPFEHNPGAVDPDGDSLTYELVPCRGFNSSTLEYVDPDQVVPGSNNKISINRFTGDLLWDSPQRTGIYNVAILITEWRNGRKVGSVIRDMQINVFTCTNRPPKITQVDDTCIAANVNLTVLVHAEDPDSNDVQIFASGYPFTTATNKATFNPVLHNNYADGELKWLPSCDEVRLQPYQIILRAKDNGIKPLTDYSSFYIKVVAPEVENLTSLPVTEGIRLSWNSSVCRNADCYKIYRRQNRAGFVHGYCETGVPSHTGYTLIAQISATDTTYTDTLVPYATQYCYLVTACFNNGAEGYAGTETCVEMSLELPQIIKVSVQSTNRIAGIDSVQWCHPRNEDITAEFKGPFQYLLYRSAGFKKAETLIYSGPLVTQLRFADTTYIDAGPGLDTDDSLYTYRVELINKGNVLVGSSANASSVFLQIDPGDRLNTLSWDYKTPWVNDTFIVQRLNPGTFLFEEISRTTESSYTDSGLFNGTSYCYRLIVLGHYDNPVYPQNILNYSQEECATPVDKTPPCNPDFNVTGYCEQGYAEITWDTTTKFCNEDLEVYQLWYSPTKEGELQIIRSFPRDSSIFFYANESSLAGCFSFSALDTNGNQSKPINKICVDNCPDYKLPNVFSPNNDGINDYFRPFPYRGIKSINAKIFNRWGKELFSTTDPEIMWDGKSGGKPVPDGVYFYVVNVTSITLDGESEMVVKGSVTIFTGSNKDKE